eukprot:CAMPEP_0119560400 /NCGR_PEP_ID=MMETSP1352-20130426/14799_1 /TAXON_ID=265584 /ORGANISM="Stauroneis constricta, Strain CCMP1120" /LENGTH=124 /DNA_ID=CAMNT_0007608367 /DNA_START=27 /DNA_END=399 /DNA_ORIENTATION=+
MITAADEAVSVAVAANGAAADASAMVAVGSVAAADTGVVDAAVVANDVIISVCLSGLPPCGPLADHPRPAATDASGDLPRAAPAADEDALGRKDAEAAAAEDEEKGEGQIVGAQPVHPAAAAAV